MALADIVTGEESDDIRGAEFINGSFKKVYVVSSSAFNGKKSPTPVVSAGRAALEGIEIFEWSRDPVDCKLSFSRKQAV